MCLKWLFVKKKPADTAQEAKPQEKPALKPRREYAPAEYNDEFVNECDCECNDHDCFFDDDCDECDCHDDESDLLNIFK